MTIAERIDAWLFVPPPAGSVAMMESRPAIAAGPREMPGARRAIARIRLARIEVVRPDVAGRETVAP